MSEDGWLHDCRGLPKQHSQQFCLGTTQPQFTQLTTHNTTAYSTTCLPRSLPVNAGSSELKMNGNTLSDGRSHREAYKFPSQQPQKRKTCPNR